MKMVDKLEIVKELNLLIEALIIHGGGDGGPYYTEPEAVKTQVNYLMTKVVGLQYSLS